MAVPDVLRIANCSGFYGDRLSAAREMVEGGPIDVLTGDYLAELTMAILYRSRLRKPETGYATTFLTQMEAVLDACLARGIRVVANAGGLNPAGLAAALRALADRLGLRPRIAWITGDDVLDRLPAWQAAGHPLEHLDRGTPLRALAAPVVTANAYLGGWGIAEALARGADVVVTGRVTDAALVLGPAAWRFGWRREEWDRLAAAVVAGHIIECGAQCCGGKYAFFDEVPGYDRIGFPVCEMAADGTFVVTKHPGDRRAGLRRDRHGPAPLRDRRPPATSIPTSRPASTQSGSRAPGRTASACAGSAGSPRPPRPSSTTWAATGTA